MHDTMQRYDLVKIPPSEGKKSSTTNEDPLFYNDFKGDDLNIRYGGLHKGDVPRYRRLGGQSHSIFTQSRMLIGLIIQLGGLLD